MVFYQSCWKKSTKKSKGDMFEGEIRWWILAQYTKRLLFCLDLTFPSGATEEKGKKKRVAQRLLGVFVMSPSRHCVCMHISDPGRDGDKDKYIQHARRCIHTNILLHQEKEYPPRIIRSVMLSNSDSPTKLEHQWFITSRLRVFMSPFTVQSRVCTV